MPWVSPAMLGHHAYDSADRVGPPNGCTRPANDLDPVENLQRGVFRRPVDRPAHHLQDLPTVHHGKEFLSRRAAEVAHRDEVVVTDAPGDVHARDVAEGINHQHVSVQADAVRTNHVHGRRVAPIFLLETEDPPDGGVREIPQIEIQQPPQLSLFERGKGTGGIAFVLGLSTQGTAEQKDRYGNSVHSFLQKQYACRDNSH